MEAHVLQISDEFGVIDPRLHHDPLRPGIAQPEIVHERTHPKLHSMLASKLLFTHKSMEASVPIIEVAASKVSPQVIFFDPVKLEVAKRFAVPASNGREAMLAVQCGLEECFLDFNGARDAPCGGDTGLVHPVM